jgi:hypothetical protein
MTVILALLWVRAADAAHIDLVTRLIVVCAIVCVAALLCYGFLISALTYTIQASPAANEVVERKVIGGFRLTTVAKQWRNEKNLTIDQILKRVGFQLDKVWTRGSRALAKQVFVLCYLVLTVAGSVALTCAAILMLVFQATGKGPR